MSFLEIHASDSLEKWNAQMSELIDSGVFGEHRPNDCLFCRAQRIVELIQDLRDKMHPPNSSMGGSGNITSDVDPTHITQQTPGNTGDSSHTSGGLRQGTNIARGES
jgi:hypothetical protein